MSNHVRLLFSEVRTYFADFLIGGGVTLNVFDSLQVLGCHYFLEFENDFMTIKNRK